VYAMCQILAGPRAAGRWVGVENSIGSLAGVAAPAVTGFIIQSTGHFTYAFVAAGAMSLFGLIGWIWMVPTLKELKWTSGEPPSGAVEEPSPV